MGILNPWDSWASRSRRGLWSRSLLSIYDLEDLVHLDTPWWTFEAVDVVETFLMERPDARVFEWGSGASSVWLAKRSSSVKSIEHDRSWAQRVRALLPDNAEVVVVPATYAANAAPGVRSARSGYEKCDFSAYSTAINDEAGVFDLIVIDGRAREACLSKALERLAPRGLVVFDNVERHRYRNAIAQFGNQIQIQWTKGLTPCLPYPSQTAIIQIASE